MVATTYGACTCSEPREACIDLIICGGESGPQARPMHPDWARSARGQCAEAPGTAFFFKQWGEWGPGECADFAATRTERTATWFADRWSFGLLTPRQSEETHRDDEPDLYRIGKARAGRMLDGREHNDMPGRR
jgi:protein gp37